MSQQNNMRNLTQIPVITQRPKGDLRSEPSLPIKQPSNPSLDKEREDKLAAARKKLQKFQERMEQKPTVEEKPKVQEQPKNPEETKKKVEEKPPIKSAPIVSPKLQTPVYMPSATAPPQLSPVVKETPPMQRKMTMEQPALMRQALDIVTGEKQELMQKVDKLELALKQQTVLMTKQDEELGMLRSANAAHDKERAELEKLRKAHEVTEEKLRISEAKARDFSQKENEMQLKLRQMSLLVEEAKVAQGQSKDLQKLQKDHGELRVKFQSLAEELKSKDARLEKLLEERNELSDEVKTLKDNSATLNNTIESLKKQMFDSLEKERVESEAKLKQAAEKQSELETEVERLQEQIQAQEEEKAEETIKEARYDAALIRDLRAQLETEQKNFAELQSEHQRLIAVASGDKQERAMLNEQLDELKRRITELNEKNFELNSLSRSLQVELDASKNELSNIPVLQQQIESLKERLLQKEAEQSRIEQTEEEALKEEENVVIEDNSTVEDLKRRLEQAEAESKQTLELRAQNTKLLYQIEQLGYQNERLHMEAETVPAYIEKYHQERTLLRAKSLQKDKLVQKLVERYDVLIRDFQRLSQLLADKRRSSSSAEPAASATDSLKEAVSLVEEADHVLRSSNSPDPHLDHPHHDHDSHASLTRLSRRLSWSLDEVTGVLFPPCQDCQSTLIDV